MDKDAGVRTAAEIAVHHAARVQEGQPFGKLHSSLQDRIHAGLGPGVGGCPEEALVYGHLRIT